MASIMKGILEPFSGTIGTVVGVIVDGKGIIKSRPTKSSAPPSPKQLALRAKFKLMVQFLQCFTGLLRISYVGFVKKSRAFDNAVSYNIEHAVSGVYPFFTIDYPQVLVARGDLPNATGSAASTAGRRH